MKNPPLFCPIHKLEMYYWPQGDLYACQNSACKYRSGHKRDEIEPPLSLRIENTRQEIDDLFEGWHCL